MSVAFAGLAYASMSTPEQPHKARLEKLTALAVPSPRMRRTKYVSGSTKAAEASTDDSTQQASAAEGEEAAGSAGHLVDGEAGLPQRGYAHPVRGVLEACHVQHQRRVGSLMIASNRGEVPTA